MTTTHRSVRLARRPTGMPTADDFTITDAPLPALGDGEVQVRISHVSLDPAMRGWMNEGKSYVPPVGIGDVMRSFSAGTVEASNHPDFAPGDAVTGIIGVRDRAVVPGADLLQVDYGQAPPERWIGGLGMPGMTAYFGLLRLGQPKPGETVLVSAASGAVGSLVGQIAKLKGCRAVGIAGGPDKCRHVVETLGFDACVDYKADDFRARLKDATPDGVDIYFENVGGEIFDAALSRMNLWGRIPVCGMISQYTATTQPPPFPNFRSVLVNRLTIRGFIIFDFAEDYAEAVSALGQWHADDKLVMTEDVRDGGLDAFPDVLKLLFTGGNLGKLVLKVG